MKYDNICNYYITLISGQLSSLFPNTVKNKNDKFYYLVNNALKTITFTEGAYEVTDINANIQFKAKK